MKKFAVIVAGGTGSRMGKDIPKQFLTINGKAIILYTIDAFISAFPDIEIVLVLHPDYIDYGRQLIVDAGLNQKFTVLKGGATRFQSVKNGLSVVTPDSIVFVHDAVRCLIDSDLIRKCFDEAVVHGSAIPVIPVRDSLRKWDKQNGSSSSVSRDNLYIVQTPQTFQSAIIMNAFQAEEAPSFTDEATVVEAMGEKVNLVEGEGKNIKITFPEDLAYAGWILRSN